MTKTQIYYYEKEVLLSSKEIKRYFKNTVINFEKLKQKNLLKPIRIENKLFYKLSNLLQASYQ